MKLKKALSLTIAIAMLFTLVSTLSFAASSPKYTVVTESSVEAVPAAQNGILNGTVDNINFFEGNVSPWKHAVTDPDVKIQGTRSLRIDASQDDGGAGINVATEIFDDEAYKFTMYVKATNLTANSYGLQAYVTGAAAGTQTLQFTPDPTRPATPGLLDGKWVKGVMYFTADQVPNGSHLIHIMRMPAKDATVTETGVYYIDNISLEIINKSDIPTDVVVTPPPVVVVVKAPTKPVIKNATKITAKTKYLEGKTSAKAFVKVLVNKKVVDKGTANTKGDFKIKVNFTKLKKKTKVYVYAYRLKGKTEVKSSQVYVTIR